ncbi:MAG: FtsX-like permease family protein, partial [Lachnospiraceae bacterium]|nr:FtsX-like permease family protein [Lachnospiraceae bacterium]
NEKKIKKSETQLEKAEKELKSGKKQLEEGKSQLKKAKEELSEGKADYKKANKKWKKKKAEAEEDIADAKQKLADAKVDLADLEMPEWYVLSRNSIETYVEYEQNAERIEAIGEVFPVIFFLVAALVCLTTMTRMVSEDRTQIGVLKALGYTRMQISMKYLLYALSSTLIGSLIGIVAGQKILPVVIIKAYGIMYNNLPDILSPLYLKYSLMSTAAALVCVVWAAWSACKKTLREVPANLMRPVAPKLGKRVFLERIPWIWNRLGFSKKAAVRNLVRYKKRLYMTVFGIGGCMGLLLVGFGLKDSIMSIGTLQFGQVRLYDASIGIEDDASEEEKDTLYEKLQNDERVKDQIFVKEAAVDVSANHGTKSAYMVVPKEPKRLNTFIALKERLSDKKYHLSDDGVILTEKIASLLEVQVGDSIELKEDDTKGIKVTVTGIVENYFYHYVFLSPALYEKLYGEEPEYGSIYTRNVENGDAFEDQFKQEYIDLSMVSDVTFVSKTAKRVADMLKSMDTIIYVLVISAGLLAFVVLYNLNNINISERKRELATLKVLGFYDGEVSRYIFRENLILTLLGTIAGVGIGIALHRFVIITAEIDSMMFGRNITLKSYLISVLLTMMFALFVNAFMHFKMKKIDMIESLKSVE